MKRLSMYGLFVAFASATLLAGCGSDSKVDSSIKGDAGADAGAVPKPSTDHSPCIISADCGGGLHCDLGECVQECNTDSACTGDKSCSARARCLDQDQPDEDPPPPTTTVGTLDVSPMAVSLTRANNGKTLNLSLATNSTAEVRYRVEVDAPYLSVDKTRGSFKSETTIPVKIDTSNIVARDIAGTVTIYSTLGTATVRLPLHMGLTGSYHGSLNYNGDAIPLGATRFDLEVMESNGDVSARIVPERSMLFPKGANDDAVAYGFGSLNSDGTVDLTIEHLFDPSALGTASKSVQNHLMRSIGRRVIVHLTSATTGIFDGSFTESIYGLFQNPVQAKGAMHLEFVPQKADPAFTTKNVIMPTITSGALFPVSFLSNFPVAAGDCRPINASSGQILTAGYAPLLTAVATTTTSYSDLSKNCKSILGMSGASAATTTNCGWLATEACAMRNAAQTTDYAGSGAAEGAFAQAILAPAALVTHDELSTALKESVTIGTGLSGEIAHYDTALNALSPVAKWLMQPGMLEFFRNIPANSAATSPTTFLPSLTGTAAEQYPLARALAQLVQLLVDVNAERQRVANLTTSTDASRGVQAQYNATITYLEAVALLGVLNNWSVAPVSATASVTGVLTKLDHAFTDMTQDAGTNLGTTSRHVPFVYRADDIASGTTNFEQKLTIASKAVTQLQTEENNYKTNATQIDQASYNNKTQWQNSVDQLELQIHDICGTDFDVKNSPIDWTKCGKVGGTLAEALLDVQNAQASAQATAQRAKGQQDKINVDIHLVAQKKQMRDDELAFIDSSNNTINANNEAINMMTAVQEALKVASNSNLWNAGAPAAMAVADFGLSMMKNNLSQMNDQLKQEQDMTVRQTDANIEYADGMANIKREEIDLRELVIEADQSVIGILEAQVKAANALSRAQELYNSRAKAQQLVSSDPSMDPSYRIVRDKAALSYIDARDVAQRQLLAAGRALEYEIDRELPTMPVAVQSARNYTSISALQACLDTIFDNFNEIYSAPQLASTNVSVRKLFGITGPRRDDVTGETLSEGEQFRAYVLKNQSLDADGTLKIQFSTNLMPGNGLWSTSTCIDKISEVQAQLVGDFLGDNEAEVRLELSGTAVLRSCDTNELRDWNLDTAGVAVIQAGVNTFGDVTNTSLFGQSVARATWTLIIQGGNLSPSNSDVNVGKLDDIVLKIKHKASPLHTSSSGSVDDSCLTKIINNG